MDSGGARGAGSICPGRHQRGGALGAQYIFFKICSVTEMSRFRREDLMSASGALFFTGNRLSFVFTPSLQSEVTLGSACISDW